MAKKKRIPSKPSKAYLVSFGDTMTALLAFFIVLNSLATEQTGAKLYDGTGSFVEAFSNSGAPGPIASDRSKDMISQVSQKPIYALAENMDREQGDVGPDDTDENERVIDREKEQFQKFLAEMNTVFGLHSDSALENQTVFDSFVALETPDGGVSRHSLKLMGEGIATLRQPESRVEVILWAAMPGQKEMLRRLDKMTKFQKNIENMFWISPDQKRRIKYRVKPWLFSDAKRPVLSVILSRVGG